MSALRIVDRREDLGHLCNELGLTKALEVGTHQGVFADMFMARFGGTLVCVDPWEGQPAEGTWQPVFVPNVYDRELDKRIAEVVLTGKYPGRVSCIKGTLRSIYDALDGEESFDFIYIDGAHTSTNVMKDLQIANKLLKPGGLLAGHDYDLMDPNLCGVVAVVNWFVIEYGFDLYLTREDYPKSWYARRPEDD